MRTTQQPKKNISRIKLIDKPFGNEQRYQHAVSIVEKSPVFPKPLEYEDIDAAFFKFVDEEIDLSIDGERVPTYTLYSSQRFSEYSQTWSHTDKENNLLMNFKTVNRDSNPDTGENQGGLWNIPGERRYTLKMSTVMEEDGKEVYEIYSMLQPYCVNMSFRVNFVTSNYDNVNRFNEKILNLFKSRQKYIQVNGHYIPMIVEEINDETQYGVEEQKFFTQSVVIKVMAYIIHESDFKVERVPKYPSVFVSDSSEKKKPQIDIEEYESKKFEYRRMDISIKLDAWNDKVEFEADSDMVVENIELSNIRSYRLSLNSEPTFSERGFKIKEGDSVRFRIFPYEINRDSQIILRGYNPNVLIDLTDTPEFASEQSENYESVTVE